MLLNALLAIAGFTAFAQAHAEPAKAAACVVQFEKPEVRAEICQISPDQRIVQISFARSPQTKLTVHAEFRRSLLSFDGNGYQKMWDRFWTTGAMPRLTREDQKSLASAINEIPLAKLDENLRGFSDFLVTFVEANSHIENFDSATQPRNSKVNRYALRSGSKFTSICEFRGQVREAKYTIGKKVRIVFAVVGQPENKCRGRCGTACSQYYFQWNHNQYTQECLDHDACRDETGQIFGECADEFWTAAAGYVNAPDCAAL